MNWTSTLFQIESLSRQAFLYYELLHQKRKQSTSEKRHSASSGYSTTSTNSSSETGSASTLSVSSYEDHDIRFDSGLMEGFVWSRPSSRFHRQDTIVAAEERSNEIQGDKTPTPTKMQPQSLKAIVEGNLPINYWYHFIIY